MRLSQSQIISTNFSNTCSTSIEWQRRDPNKLCKSSHGGSEQFEQTGDSGLQLLGATGRHGTGGQMAARRRGGLPVDPSAAAAESGPAEEPRRSGVQGVGRSEERLQGDEDTESDERHCGRIQMLRVHVRRRGFQLEEDDRVRWSKSRFC